jgi:tripartite-type tricarboxylate transporter receptor subunit TctC
MSHSTKSARSATGRRGRLAGLMAASALAGMVSFAGAALADTAAVADFYKGKTIRVVVGAPAGDAYDTYARLLVRHLGNHIPGNPGFVVENQPGAGGMVELNNAYNLGPFDGTLVYSLNFNMPLFQMLGESGVKYDLKNISCMGRLLASNAVTAVAKASASGVTDLASARDKEAVIGSTGVASNSTQYPVILNRMAGTKFKVVPGYEGAAALLLAMDRGEVDGFGSYSYLTFKSTRPQYLDEINPIVQWGEKREEAWPNTPTAMEIATNDVDQRAMQVVSAGPDLGFSYCIPPNVPQERVEALQTGFDETVKDPDFLSDAANAKLDLRVATGQEVSQIVSDVLTAPANVVDRVRDLIKPAD